MEKVIEAIYEKGVFKPLARVDLKEGEIVEIEIKEKKISDRFIECWRSLRREFQRLTMLSKF